MFVGSGRVPPGSLSGPGLLDGAVPELIHVVRVRAELDAVIGKFRHLLSNWSAREMLIVY